MQRKELLQYRAVIFGHDVKANAGPTLRHYIKMCPATNSRLVKSNLYILLLVRLAGASDFLVPNKDLGSLTHLP